MTQEHDDRPRGAATGTQHRLRWEGRGRVWEATVTELAAALRTLSLDGQDVVEPFGEHELPPMGAGIVLAPWPNRVAGGRWTLDGKPQQLDLTEPALGNAIHGLLRNTGYRAVDSGPSSVTLEARIFPQHGYPFHLLTRVRYRLDEGGLSATHTLTHVEPAGGERPGPAPVGVGVHPYVKVGDRPVDELVLTVGASQKYVVDSHKIPIGKEQVSGRFDLRGGQRIADLSLDHGFSGLELDRGAHRHRLAHDDGSWVEVWAGPEFPYVQVFTPADFAGRGRAVAVEPMTCPADALNSGEGLVWLEPGASFSGTWGVAARL